MNHATIFNLDQFLTLNGDELIHYVEPFVNFLPSYVVLDSTYDFLCSALKQLDAAHTVYALEICMAIRPVEFVERAVEYLSSSDAAVCCAAYNAVDRIAPEELSEKLVKQIHAIPQVDLYSHDYRSGERRHMGTNERFLQEIRAKLQKHSRGKR